jgi:hypothetical protein
MVSAGRVFRWFKNAQGRIAIRQQSPSLILASIKFFAADRLRSWTSIRGLPFASSNAGRTTSASALVGRPRDLRNV